MKRINYYLSLLMLMIMAAACSEDFDTPPLITPHATHTANMTLAEFKAQYWQDGRNYIDTIKEEIYIHGWVASDDAAGNIFKYIYIQDENGDGLGISIDQASLNTYYRRGQEVVISMKDFWIGKYNGQLLLGQPEWYAAQSAWEAGRMTLAKFQEHTEVNGLPDLSKIQPTVCKISDFSGKSDRETQIKYQGRLIKLQNVKWDDADGKEPYAIDRDDNKSTERKISDTEGNQLIVTNSMFADFHTEKLPLGEGDITGVLYLTGDDKWQLLLRDLEDVEGFAGTKGSISDPYNVAEVIERQGSGKNAWVEAYVVGAVAPEVTTVKANTDIEWQAPASMATTLVIAANADETDYTKCLIVPLPQGSRMRQQANLKDNPEILHTKIWIKGEFSEYMGTYGIQPLTGSTDEYKLSIATGGVTEIDENFESGLPSDWTNVQVAGNKAWYTTTFSGNTYAAMTGYKGTPPFDSWLITPAIAINKATNKNLKFRTQVNGYNSTTSHFEVYVLSTNDPSTAEKVKLNPTIATPPASGYSDWAESGDLDLSQFNGTYYIGFRFEATADANYATWCVDDVKFNYEGTTPKPVAATRADFETMNGGDGKSTFGTLTSTAGWTANNCSLLKGGTVDSNPTFKFIGLMDGSTTNYCLAPCLNGKTSAAGQIISPVLTGGITNLSFNYAMPYSDSAIKLKVDIVVDDQAVETYTVEQTAPEKYKVYTFTQACNVPSSQYRIVINNLSPSNQDSNKDRVAVWNLKWSPATSALRAHRRR